MLNWTNFLFNVLSIFCLISGLLVIFSKNPIHSVLFLILVFANVVNLLVLLNIEFIGLIFLIVYVGAIAVLFLFIVMMLNIKIIEVSELLIRYVAVGAVISLIFLINMVLLFNFWGDSYDVEYIKYIDMRLKDGSTDWAGHLSGPTWVEVYNNINDWSNADVDGWVIHLGKRNSIVHLGELLYVYFPYLLILASIILLVAMVGAIVLTLQHKIDVKKQDLFAQTARLVNDAIYLTRVK